MYYVSPSLFVIDFVNIRGFSGDIANGRAGRNPAISMKNSCQADQPFRPECKLRHEARPNL